jgi:hypothetical protein
LENLGVRKENHVSQESQKSGGNKNLYYYALAIIIIILGYFSFIMFSDQNDSPGVIHSEKINKDPTIEGSMSDTMVTSLQDPVKDKSLKAANKSGKQRDQVVDDIKHLPTGNLIVFSDPPTDVYIDSDFRGKTPFQNAIKISAGVHNVLLQHEGFPEYQEKFQIESGQTKILSFDLDTLYGYLSCQVYPWGMVLVDGELIGETPLPEPVVLSPGKHSITIENPGFKILKDSLEVVQQETTYYRINLEKRAGQ